MIGLVSIQIGKVFYFFPLPAGGARMTRVVPMLTATKPGKQSAIEKSGLWNFLGKQPCKALRMRIL
jgi:hypothetical protein